MAPLPIMQVKTMQAQGMDNNQIIQALQRDGYNASQVFDAMNQASMSDSSPVMPQTKKSDFMDPTPFPPQPPAGAPPMPPMGAPQPPQPPVSNDPISSTSTEEMVEAIIDEKWNELVKDITMIIDWKNQAQETIVSMEQQFKDLKDQFDKLHQALIAKIGEYDKNILDVGAEVKAMEKVFSKVLPVFTENVATLDKITKNMQGQDVSQKDE